MQTFRALMAAALALAATAASAQYPDHPIKLVVPYSAGGAADAQSRIVAVKLGTRLGQQVVVENRPGASGTIGAAAVARAPADGYTLLYDATAHAVNPVLYKSLSYDSKRDFLPISLVSRTPNLLVVRNESPYRSVAELTAAARQKPGHITFATPGQGTAQHIAAALYAQGFGLTMTHIPYKGGAPALTDLMGGQVDMMFSNMAASSPLVKSGKLRALAVSSRERVAGLPDVPTMAESGLSGYAVYEWNGVFAPAGTPPDVAARLEREIRAVLQDPAVRHSLEELGAQPIGSSSREFADFVAGEMQRAEQVLSASGIKQEHP
ncbi:Bug family tripartite tricarboxylate transporter substrate binding protein [Bordetella bronchialis]|uniref:LacI family transcriptional regulator n=1 Tax=Bordetella bronchialis TaxID=463025 RepID=A0A193FX10_9BORD|nr:tripartite tricarboxylate transporter substrate binding protein [Bordetella bronchialis]ANN67087.1 LacI family transcriptional regulator [Bordetella bronchialis]ANN72165.1 LacI family transcriptional regulator [Bordetella bronchialis]